MNAPLLLVESDDLVRESLGRALRSEGFDVLAVSDCQQAFQRLTEGHVFLIILDLDSPSHDGWAEAQRLASKRAFRPMVVITARTGQERWAAEAGVEVLMEKPLSLPTLVDTIKELLDQVLQAQIPLRERAGALGVPVPAGPMPGLSLGTL